MNVKIILFQIILFTVILIKCCMDINKNTPNSWSYDPIYAECLIKTKPQCRHEYITIENIVTRGQYKIIDTSSFGITFPLSSPDKIYDDTSNYYYRYKTNFTYYCKWDGIHKPIEYSYESSCEHKYNGDICTIYVFFTIFIILCINICIEKFFF